LAVDPGKDFAFFPPQVLTGPVDGQSPVPPFLATMRSGNMAAISRADSILLEPPSVPARGFATLRCLLTTA